MRVRLNVRSMQSYCFARDRLDKRKDHHALDVSKNKWTQQAPTRERWQQSPEKVQRPMMSSSTWRVNRNRWKPNSTITSRATETTIWVSTRHQRSRFRKNRKNPIRWHSFAAACSVLGCRTKRVARPFASTGSRERYGRRGQLARYASYGNVERLTRAHRSRRFRADDIFRTTCTWRCPFAPRTCSSVVAENVSARVRYDYNIVVRPRRPHTRECLVKVNLLRARVRRRGRPQERRSSSGAMHAHSPPDTCHRIAPLWPDAPPPPWCAGGWPGKRAPPTKRDLTPRRPTKTGATKPARPPTRRHETRSRYDHHITLHFAGARALRATAAAASPPAPPQRSRDPYAG